MQLEKVNNSATTRKTQKSEETSNVSTFVKKEEKTYVRRYAMAENRRRVWLENHKPNDDYAIMFPSARMMARDEAAANSERRDKAKVLIVCLAIAVVLLMLYPIVKFSMSRLVISEVLVEGSGMYTAEELLEAGGLDVGGRLPILSASTAEEKLLSNMPYIKSCKISVKFPNTVIFDIKDETAVICAEIFGEYYALSNDLRVLERSDSRESFPSLLYVELPFAERAVVGERLVFPEGEDGEYISTFLELISGSDLNDRIGIVYFDEKFDIVASVDDKYRVLFGSPSDMKLKIATVSKIIEENSEACLTTGVIDVRVVDIAGVVLNVEIDPNSRE